MNGGTAGRGIWKMSWPKACVLDKYLHPDWDDEPEVNGYVHALVTSAGTGIATLKFGRYTAALGQPDVAWTQQKLADILKTGDICYVKILSLGANGAAHVSLEQDSGAQGSLLAIDNATGGIKAMVGGRDFNESKFDRATQAMRQVGSSFKPYVYTTVIDGGASPDDTILDEPVSFETPSGPYSPHNYDEKFEGIITLRRALAQSRNIPALKLANKVGIKSRDRLRRAFWHHGETTAVFAGGAGIGGNYADGADFGLQRFSQRWRAGDPRYITRVTDYEGRVLEEDFPDVKDVISERTARIMTSMLREVVLHGTGIAAAKLPFPVAGKTGTTNDFTDAWFMGFSPTMTCGVWVGYDEKKSLGAKETGAHAALPIWMNFMTVAMAGKDPGDFQSPPATSHAVAQKVDTPDAAPATEEAH